MPFYETRNVRLHYQRGGAGFPLLIIYGGGLDSAGVSHPQAPFNAMEEFKSDYHCITMDLRHSNHGKTTGPLEIDAPWDAHTDDQLALLDQLGIDKFHMMGFCIGNQTLWNMIKRAPDRVVSGVSAQPSGWHPDYPNYLYTKNLERWAPKLIERRPDLSMEMVDKYLINMYRDKDFVVTVSRDFVRNCQIPLLVLPDDSRAHSYSTAMEMVNLAPNAQVSLYPWKDRNASGDAPLLKDAPCIVTLAVRHMRTFLKANTPAAPDTTISNAGSTLTRQAAQRPAA